jgi:hypothetical protein
MNWRILRVFYEDYRRAAKLILTGFTARQITNQNDQAYE